MARFKIFERTEKPLKPSEVYFHFCNLSWVELVGFCFSSFDKLGIAKVLEQGNKVLCGVLQNVRIKLISLLPRFFFFPSVSPFLAISFFVLPQIVYSSLNILLVIFQHCSPYRSTFLQLYYSFFIYPFLFYLSSLLLFPPFRVSELVIGMGWDAYAINRW